MQTRPTPTRRPPTAIPSQRSAHDAELVDEMDSMLDDIDELLEEQEWMTTYVQKGGQ